MQDLSFTFPNVTCQIGEFEISAMIYTFTNAFSLDPQKTSIQQNDDTVSVCAKGLLTHGGQSYADGSVNIQITKSNTSIRVDAAATISQSTEELRCLKLTVETPKNGKIMNLIDARPKKITSQGIRFKYPEGWRDAGTPLVILKQESGKFLYFRSLDTQVREKTFVFAERNGKLQAELVFEETATQMRNSICVPTWEIGYSDSKEAISAEHCSHIRAAYDLQPWETRPDVPTWAHEISLIAAIHAQHWTGYIFNDYDQILRNIQTLCEKIEPKRILAFLPGWEGRYYWKYGNYGPDERMGGEKGFHRLCDGARDLGVHLMPMFGIDIVGVHHNGFAEWGEPCELRTASGNFSRASVDWDGSRHYDHSSNRTLNPASPKWQNRLVQQITSLADTYDFDAAFLDIAAVWANDPNHNVYEGVCKLAKRLRENRPEMLLAGEGWYDGLMACIPLLQCGHTDGKLHWHDEAYPPMLDTFARNFGHLCLGDPSRFSTGVHEQGINPEWRAPMRKGVIPTLTIVDGTLDYASERVDRIILDAKEYAERFL